MRDSGTACVAVDFVHVAACAAFPCAIVAAGRPARLIWRNAAFAAALPDPDPPLADAPDDVALRAALAAALGAPPGALSLAPGPGGSIVVMAALAAPSGDGRLLRQIIDLVPDCIYAKDAAGRFLVKNRFDAELMGAASPEETIGRTDFDYFPPDVACATAADDRAVIEGAAPIVGKIERLVDNSGRERHFSTTKMPLHDAAGRAVGLVGIGRDVTEVVELQRRLEAMAENYRAAAERAEEALAIKSRFLATMSHELRTPMNGVLGIAAVLDATDLSDRQRGFVRVIRESGDLLLRIVNDILDFSRVERDGVALDPAPFALAEIADRLGRLHGEKARAKGLDFEISCADPAGLTRLGDATRIERIGHNLIGNAIKFTPKGSVVARFGTDGDVVSLTVEDTGIGVAPEAMRRIFQPFTQADETTTRRFGGSGLGLAIVSTLAEAMGGAVDARSEPGVGSVFVATFRAPRCDADAADAPPAPARAGEAACLRADTL